jgi:hypothetical protein
MHLRCWGATVQQMSTWKAPGLSVTGVLCAYSEDYSVDQLHCLYLPDPSASTDYKPTTNRPAAAWRIVKRASALLLVPVLSIYSPSELGQPFPALLLSGQSPRQKSESQSTANRIAPSL